MTYCLIFLYFFIFAKQVKGKRGGWGVKEVGGGRIGCGVKRDGIRN